MNCTPIFASIDLASFSISGFAADILKPDKARSQSIAATLKRIQAEKSAAGFATSDAWFDSLGPFRKNLIEYEQKNKQLFVRKNSDPTKPDFALHIGEGTPPVFVAPHLLGAAHLNGVPSAQFFKERSHTAEVVAVDRWLKTKGIRLVVLPVPELLDIYPERFFSTIPGFPPKGGIDPYVRTLLADLLINDVEVEDILPAVSARKTDPGFYFFSPMDSHWSYAGRHLAARQVAQTLQRDPIIGMTSKEKPKFSVRLEIQDEGSPYLPYLKPEEIALLKAQGHPVRPLPVVYSVDGQRAAPSPTGPVLVIGNSFAPGLTPFLSLELNQPIREFFIAGSSTETIRELFRDPEKLQGVRYVIWVMNYLGFCVESWAALPPPISRLATAPRPQPLQ